MDKTAICHLQYISSAIVGADVPGLDAGPAVGSGYIADVVGAFFIGNGIVVNGALVLRIELGGLGGGSEGRHFLSGGSEEVLREGGLGDAALVGRQVQRRGDSYTRRI